MDNIDWERIKETGDSKKMEEGDDSDEEEEKVDLSNIYKYVTTTKLYKQ